MFVPMLLGNIVREMVLWLWQTMILGVFVRTASYGSRMDHLGRIRTFHFHTKMGMFTEPIERTGVNVIKPFWSKSQFPKY